MSMESPPPADGSSPSEEWSSITHRFSIDGHEGYVTVATDELDRPVLLEIRMAKAGGVLRGLLDALATSVSLGLQHGVPLAAYVDQLAFSRFDPSGWTKRGYAHSVVDYLFRWLKEKYPDPGAVEAPPLDVQAETCRVCGLAVTWDPGSPCPDCGDISLAIPPPADSHRRDLAA